MKQINAVILDWAGTTVDFGSFAPTQILSRHSNKPSISTSAAEARIPMGLGKCSTSRRWASCRRSTRWRQKLGRSMTHQDIDALYRAFMPLQIAKVIDFADPIEGVPQVIAGLREQGIKIGSCSGYPRAVMEVLVPAAAQRGYAPDYWVATDDLAAGGRRGRGWRCRTRSRWASMRWRTA